MATFAEPTTLQPLSRSIKGENMITNDPELRIPIFLEFSFQRQDGISPRTSQVWIKNVFEEANVKRHSKDECRAFLHHFSLLA